MELFAHQKAIVDRFPKRELMAWQPRTGKTLPAIHLANKAGHPALVIVPKALYTQWHASLMAHAKVPFDLMTKEQFRKLAATTGGRQTLIVDEAHHFSGMHSDMSKQLDRWIRRHNPECIYFLTGTPYRSTPWNIYRLAQLLGHRWNYMDFRRKFFVERYLGRGVVYVPKPDCQDELADLVRTIGSIVRLEDCTDMPKDPVPEVISIPKTEGQLALEKEILENESNPLVRFGKMHQAASGIYLGNEFMGERVNIESGKDAKIIEYIEQYDRALVFCKYNLQLLRYKKLFEEQGIPCVVINGATKDIEKARQEVRDLRYGAALINMSCSEGYDFSGYSLTIYASLSYSYLDFEQSQGRTKHMLKRVPNTYVILNTKDSADTPVWESIENKQSFSEAIYVQKHGW